MLSQRPTMMNPLLQQIQQMQQPQQSVGMMQPPMSSLGMNSHQYQGFNGHMTPNGSMNISQGGLNPTQMQRMRMQQQQQQHPGGQQSGSTPMGGDHAKQYWAKVSLDCLDIFVLTLLYSILN